jgi:hypothetical protein
MGFSDYILEIEPAALVVLGFILFVVPEPATSTLGVAMMLLGIAWWIQWS